jgi:hypothetical protein
MPETYFFVKVWVNKDLSSFGPYLSIKDAADILVDHIQGFLPHITVAKKWRYSAEIHESILTESGWETINVPITENECFMKKHHL